MTSVRADMIAGAARLLAARGLQGTSFSEVLAATGAPRGSLYHHFPGGKAELVIEATHYVGQRLLDALEGSAASTPQQVVEQFTRLWRRVLTGSELRSGCAVAAVTIGASAEDPRLMEAAGTAFRSWRTRLAARLGAVGVQDDVAAAFAATMLAAVEGALLIARAEQDLDAFDLVAGQLREAATRL